MNGILADPPQANPETLLGPTARDLFPLPLTPFERYMVLDDTTDYPMSFVLIVNLRGTLQRPVFEQSVSFALRRHPLLMSRIFQLRSQGWCWVPEEPKPRISWTEAGQTPPKSTDERLDLTREIGLRIQVNCTSAGAEIFFQFHHACTDGLGGVQFIGDLLAFYGQKTAPEGAELPEIEPIQLDRLRARATFGVAESEAPTKKVSCPFMLGRRLIKLLRRQPVPLVATRSQNPSGTLLNFPAIISRVIERPVLQQLKVVAARKAVELNDLYLLEMFQTIREWNQKHGPVRKGQWLRIGMPTSLRTPLHDQMPAANVVSYMFLTRQAADCDQPDALLADIHRQTSTIVNERQGRFVAIGLKYVLKIPGLLRCLLRMNRCFTSVILTNVGDIRRQFTARFPLKQGRCVAGDVTLDVLTGAVPVRPNTRLSTSVGTYAGNLYINFHCDPLSFTKEQAEELADLFVTRLRRSIPSDIADDRRVA